MRAEGFAWPTASWSRPFPGPSTSCRGSNGKSRWPAIRNCGPPIRGEHRPVAELRAVASWSTVTSKSCRESGPNYRRPYQRAAGAVHREWGKRPFIWPTPAPRRDTCRRCGACRTTWICSSRGASSPCLLGEIADRGWLALFDHDPDHAAARLVPGPDREFAVAQAITEL